MNVRKCMNGTRGDQHCVFKIRRRDPETGDVADFGCVKHEVGVQDTAGVDHYNVFPEHNESSGNAVYQQVSSEPNCFRTGPMLIWENITGHGQNGLNYDFRDFAADIHPLYRREDRNLPTNSVLSDDDLGEVFGGSNPLLVNTGWSEERWFGISNVEVCNEAIYGQYNAMSDMVLPKCFKSYARDIFGWVNFTNKNEAFKKRSFYLSEMNEEQITKFCKDLFVDEKIAGRMKDALMHIKGGEFLNIWTLMGNNFVPMETKREFMDKISLRSKQELYKGTINLNYYCQLYTYIDAMRHKISTINFDGKEVKEIKYLPKELRKLYKENLINFILNYPALEDALSNTGKFETNQRYWFVIQMLKKAKKEKILNIKMPLPNWLVGLIREKNVPSFMLFGEEFDYESAPIEVKKDYDEAMILRLSGPQDLYPGIIDIRKELPDSIKFELGCSEGWITFCDILEAGRTWNMAEIRLAWEHFKPAYLNESPSDFWEWIEMIVDLPYEIETTVLLDEYEQIRDTVEKKNPHHKSGISMATPGVEEVLSFGACDFNIGEGHVSPGRAFAMNLVQQVYDYDSWDVQKQPISRNYDATARVKPLRECTHETFWSRLARFGGLIDDREEIKKILSNETYEEVMQNVIEGIANSDSVDEIGLSDSDLHLHESFDPYSGERGHLNGGVGSWTDEE